MPAGKYKNKYRIESTRLKSPLVKGDIGDFRQRRIRPLAENITIPQTPFIKGAGDREGYFGEVINEKMKLSNIGKFADQYWQEIPKHFPFVSLDEFIIMPNHVHGIIVIDHDTFGIPANVCGRDVALQRLYIGKRYVGEFPNMSKISPKSGSLSAIIRSYKSIVSDTIKNQYPDNFFAWQTRFYDHIIRDEKSLMKIREYIRNNPLKWELDRNNPENLYM